MSNFTFDSFLQSKTNNLKLDLFDYIQQHNITTLHIDSNVITSKTLEKLVVCPTLKTLNISNTKIGDDISSLNSSNLTNVEMRFNELTSNGLRQIKNNTTLKNLDISFNNICNDGFEDFLTTNNSVTHLTAINIGISAISLKLIYVNQTIVTLILSNNRLTDIVCRHISQMKQLHTLDISNNNLEGGLRYFLYSNIQVLDISNNNISSDSFIRFTQHNKSVRKLIAKGLQLESDGTNGLIHNKQIYSLDLSINNITFIGFFNLLSIPNLTELYLNHNSIDKDFIGKIIPKSRLCILQLDNNSVNDMMFRKLTNKLTHLHTLSLSNNELTKNIIQVVETLTNLIQCNVNMNRMDKSSMQQIKNIVSTHNINRKRIIKHFLDVCLFNYDPKMFDL